MTAGWKSVLAGSGATLALVGCMSQEMPGPGEGALLFAENCAMCHGVTATGDGELAREFKAETGRAPSDLTTITRRHKGTFPRAYVLSYIDGYTRGRLPQQNMPEFGLLLEGPEVPLDTGDGVMSPVPRPLAALLAYLESIQR
ncbi:c-type cytochrome [Marimonas lutisalis]|uniref:c-type cytochrome n=1 Tax=Marimonas lutisalis TaxID=2545756 RepID=UPI0010F8324A|nr:c-type cytochrome [Marimonas lutisalis]